MINSRPMLTNEQLDKISGGSDWQELDSVWQEFGMPIEYRDTDHTLVSFDERREGFLWTLKRFLENGHIRLLWWSDKSLATGTPDEQVDIIRQAFPANDEGMEDGLWFFPVGCPVGVLWEWPGRASSTSHGAGLSASTSSATGLQRPDRRVRRSPAASASRAPRDRSGRSTRTRCPRRRPRSARTGPRRRFRRGSCLPSTRAAQRAHAV